MTTSTNTCDIIQKLTEKLYESIKNDDMDNIKLCIELSAGEIKLDNCSSFDEKPDIIKLLMENDMLCEKIYGSLIVLYAIKGNVEFMKVIQKNSKNYIKFDYVSMALSSAAECNHMDAVEYLASTIVDLRSVMEMDKYNGFIGCCRDGYVEIAKYLLERGAKVDAQNNSPLILSASNGRKDIVELLLNNGVDVHARRDHALIMAIDNNHMEVVKVLLRYGANKDRVKNSVKRITDKEVLALANGEEIVQTDIKKIGKDVVTMTSQLCNEYDIMKKKLEDIKVILG